MQNYKIIICSKNRAKNDAVNSVLKDYFEKYEIKSIDTKSGVSETPSSDEEGIEGCKNRIKYAVNQDVSANLYIGMEGILEKINNHYFLCGWTVIYNKDFDEYYYGCSARIEVPINVINEFDKNKRLSDIVAKYMGCAEKEVAILGTNGMITHGAYTRTDEFIDSVLCAISCKFKKGEKEK